MLPHPLELTPGDFDAYLPERANSNAFSRPRLEFKQRALRWARNVVDRLRSLDIEMDVHGSDEHPSVRNGHRVDCQWVFFWRSHDERVELDALLDQRSGIAETLRDSSPYYRHAFLALRLDSDKVEVSAQVHPDAWVDFETWRARLSNPSGGQTTAEAIASLPEQFQYGISGRSAAPVATVNEESLRQLTERVRDEGAALWIGWTVSRDLALEHTETLDEQLEDALIALAPVYQRMAWRETDDPAGLKEEIARLREGVAKLAAERAAQEREAKQQKAREREQETERSRKRTRERLAYDATRPRPTLGDLFKPATAAAGGKDAPSEASPVRPKLPEPPAAMSHGKQRAAKRKELPKPPSVSRPQPAPPPTYVTGGALDKGAKVRVLSGPFAGKVGVVSEVDNRGGARVLLGLLSTRVLTEQLETVVESKDRPALQSSHRRNGLLGRSRK